MSQKRMSRLLLEASPKLEDSEQIKWKNAPLVLYYEKLH